MLQIGSPLTSTARKALLLGSGELVKEVVIELQRFGIEVIAVDRYANAPAMHVAHRSHVINMLDGAALRAVIEAEKPDWIIPEVEAIATPTLVELEREGYHVIPTAKAAFLTMNREGIRRLAAEELGLPTATYRFAREGYINFRLAVFAVVFALAGSYTGANISLMISNRVFKILMLFILPLVAAFVLRTKSFDGTREPFEYMKTCVLSCIIAFVIGAYDGFYGPGTGTFLILLLTSVAHLSLKEANGLTKAINLTTNITSLVVFLYNGTVLIPLGILAGLCNVAGNWIGVSFFDKKGSAVVKPVMLLVLTVFLARTILELITG